MDIPKVFISYSHDSKEHKLWVLELATRMREEGGVDAIIDQWGLKPGDDLPHFMETHLASSDYVLMICTERYVDKANSGTGGVGYEKMIITSDLISRIDSNKIIPIIRQEGTHDVPTFLKTKIYIDFSLPDEFEFSFDELIRTIQKAPIYQEPKIGKNPFTSSEKSIPDKTGDALLELMKNVVFDFERGEDYTDYKVLVGRTKVSRIMMDMLIKKAVDQGFIRLDEYGDIYLLSKGKFYAVENKLVETFDTK